MFINDYLDSGYFDAKVDPIETMIAPYVEKERKRFISFEDHKIGVDAMRRFVDLRTQSVEGQLKGEVLAIFRKEKKFHEKLIDAQDFKVEDLGEISDLK